MSYRDPKQTIDNTIGIVSQGITNFLRKTTKDIQTFAANRAAQKEEYEKNIRKNIYSAEQDLHRAYNKAVNEVNKMNPQTEDAKSFNKQLLGLLENEYYKKNAEVEIMIERGDGLRQIRDEIQESITWQGDFYNKMVKVSTANTEVIEMNQHEPGTPESALTVGDSQTNVSLYNYLRQINDDVEGNVKGTFSLFSAPKKGTYYAKSSKDGEMTEVINIDDAIKNMEENGGFFQKNMAYNATTETTGIQDIMKKMVSTPQGKEKYFDQKTGVFRKDLLYEDLLGKENLFGYREIELTNSANMWTSMNVSASLTDKDKEDFKKNFIAQRNLALANRQQLTIEPIKTMDINEAWEEYKNKKKPKYSEDNYLKELYADALNLYTPANLVIPEEEVVANTNTNTNTNTENDGSIIRVNNNNNTTPITTPITNYISTFNYGNTTNDTP